jgi:hypothetical protein
MTHRPIGMIGIIIRDDTQAHRNDRDHIGMTHRPIGMIGIT